LWGPLQSIYYVVRSAEGALSGAPRPQHPPQKKTPKKKQHQTKNPHPPQPPHPDKTKPQGLFFPRPPKGGGQGGVFVGPQGGGGGVKPKTLAHPLGVGGGGHR